MHPTQFDYQRASTLDEAFALMDEHAEAKLLAGGHSLIPMMKMRLAQPDLLIDIGKVEALRGLDLSEGQIKIGALTTHTELANSNQLQQHADLLAQAAKAIGDVQVRNRGTIGGNIAHADPGSDLPAALIALDATVQLASATASRVVDARDFFLDLLTTDLRPGELVTHILVPAMKANSNSRYLKFEHPASGYAVVGAAAWLSMSDGTCSAAGLAINGVTATPYDGTQITANLVGTDASDDAIAKACEQILPEDPMADVFATGEYRTHLAQVYARRALVAARDGASQS